MLSKIGLCCSVLLTLAACGGGGGTPTNAPPTVVVTAPSSDLEIGLAEGGMVQIDYADNDSDGAATTDLLADQDGDLATTGDQILIAASRPDMGGASQTVSWNVSGVVPGTYKIVARTSDGSAVVTGEASGQVVLNAPPSLTIQEPALDVVLSRGGQVGIAFTANDADDGAATWLFGDADGDLATTGDTTLIASLVPELNGAAHIVSWTPRVALDVPHSVLGSTWDGTNSPVSAAAPGTVTVTNAAYTLHLPGTGALSRNVDTVSAVGDGTFIAGGTFNNAIIVGQGDPAQTTHTSVGGNDAFVARYRADGTLMWSRAAVSPVDGRGWGAAAFPDGGAILTGRYGGAMTLGAGEPAETTITSSAGFDVFVSRYAPNGDLLWARGLAGTANEEGLAAEGFADGSCLICGFFGGSMVFGAGEAGETTLTTLGGEDAFLARFNADGTLAWAKQAGGAGSNDRATGIASASDGTSALTGSFTGTATFGAGEAGEAILNPTGGQSPFIARFAPTGLLMWARAPAAGGIGNDIATMPNGDLATCGSYVGTATFGPGQASETILNPFGNTDIYCARYANTGGLVWARRAGSSDIDNAFAIAASLAGEICVVGEYSNGADFGEASQRSSVQFRDAYVWRLQGNGALRDVSTGNGPNQQAGYGVLYLPDGSPVVSGNFAGPVTFGQGQEKEITLSPSAAGNWDAFITRINADGGY